MDEVEQVIIIRTDIPMGKGKTVAQGCHASVRSYEAAKQKTPRIVSDWKMQGEKKIVLKADLNVIMEIYNHIKSSLPCALISDAGLTQLEPGTITALAIGPVKKSDIHSLTDSLKLL